MNLLESIIGNLGGNTISKISGALGESEQGTKSLIGAAVPTLLSQIAGKANSEEGANQLFDMLKDNDGSQLNNFGDMLSGDKLSSLQSQGSGLLNGLMGNQLGGLSSVLSGFTGMKGGSVTSLLGMLAPLIFGSLGKAKSSLGLNASGLQNLLAGQASQFADAMPPGLADKLGGVGIGAGLSGFGAGAKETITQTVSSTKETVAATGTSIREGVSATASGAADVAADTAAAGGGLLKRLFPLLALLLLGILAFFFWRSCNGTAGSVTDQIKSGTESVTNAAKNTGGAITDAAKGTAGAVTDAGKNAVDATKNAAAKTGDAVKDAANKTGNAVKDAANKTGNVVKDGANKAGNAIKDGANKAADATSNAAGKAANAAKSLGAKALGFVANTNEALFANDLSSGKAKVGSNYILDKVNFASGSANLEQSSYGQLNNIIKVMKNYPSLKIDLVGHTDNTGNAGANQTLSERRANAVRNYIAGKGINKNRLGSKGLGGAKPVASNATSEGKRKNRRVEAVITAR